jgi:TolB protein
MPSRTRWIAALAALAVIVVVVVVTAGSNGSDGNVNTDAAPSATGGVRSEYSNLDVVDTRTRDVQQLTNNQSERFADYPSWSEAINRIVWSEPACEGCPAKLYTTDPRGVAKKRIRSSVTNVFQPSWSPDGRRVAVARPGFGIYVISVRTGRGRRISTRVSDGAPAWSPRGDLILFNRQVTATNWDIYAARPAGGRLRRLTRDSQQQLSPSWSPDGRRYAFAEQQSNGNWAIFHVKLDGSDRKQVTDSKDSSQEPAWSPDGRRFAFIAQTEGRESVAVVALDGSGKQTLTNASLATTAPAWSPDGRKIAFGAKTVTTGNHSH